MSLRILPASAADPSADQRAAETLLRQRGLVKQGRLWITANEHKLREYLASLKGLERTCLDTQKRLDACLAEMAQARSEFEQARTEHDALAKLLSEGGLSATRYNQVVEEHNARVATLNRLRPLFAREEALLDSVQVRSATESLADAQCQLALAVLFIREHLPAFAADYAQLASDAQVQHALADGQRLGPARSYQRDLGRLDRLDRLAFPDVVPLYRRDHRDCVRGILNERLAVELAWVRDQQLTLVPEVLLRAAGVELPADAPTATLTVDQARVIPVKRIVVPSLRIGPWRFEKLPVLVLPPDADELGARLGAGALPDWQAELDYLHVGFRLRPQLGDPAAAEAPAPEKPQP